MVIDLERIETTRRFSLDLMDDNEELEPGQLISPFEGRFYIKYADNQYKPFDQEIGTDDSSEIDKEIGKKLNLVEDEGLYAVDYVRSNSPVTTKEESERLESAILELFKDVTQLHNKQIELELEELHDEDLGYDG